MTAVRGCVISSIRLLNDPRSKNCLYFRNIDKKPTCETFNAALVDLDQGKVLEYYDGRRNDTLVIQLDPYCNAGDVWFVTKDALGIPIYVAEGDKGELSMEHTHPPHENLFGSDKFQQVKSIKDRMYELAFE